MNRLWQAVKATLVWSHERGTWPYDVMVAAVVIFVLLSPPGWFNDRPGVTAGGASSQVQLLSADPGKGTRTYRIDAGLIAPPRPDPQLERKTHEFLGKSVDELKGQRFQIVKIDAGRDADGTVLYYDVQVKR
jgi:hypothetical protein